mmetsp:Transcript_8376/g.21481  ORF Transcript_8376/g.21481 Transcript_8376/m.21481 type:complete len:239 (-) Transcript_8376:2195-2911(-)
MLDSRTCLLYLRRSMRALRHRSSASLRLIICCWPATMMAFSCFCTPSSTSCWLRAIWLCRSWICWSAAAASSAAAAASFCLVMISLSSASTRACPWRMSWRPALIRSSSVLSAARASAAALARMTSCSRLLTWSLRPVCLPPRSATSPISWFSSSTSESAVVCCSRRWAACFRWSSSLWAVHAGPLPSLSARRARRWRTRPAVEPAALPAEMKLSWIVLKLVSCVGSCSWERQTSHSQ